MRYKKLMNNVIHIKNEWYLISSFDLTTYEEFMHLFL